MSVRQLSYICPRFLIPGKMVTVQCPYLEMKQKTPQNLVGNLTMAINHILRRRRREKGPSILKTQ